MAFNTNGNNTDIGTCTPHNISRGEWVAVH